MADISKFVDKAYEEKSLEEIAKAPVAALEGISDAGAEAIGKVLHAHTISDLATNKYVLWAQAIHNLSK